MTEQSGPFHVTETQLAQAVDEKTFHRAQPYVREFTHRLLSGRAITGRVAGPHGVYTVSLASEDANLKPSCSCRTDGEFCRHAIALGLTYIEEPETFYDLRTLTARLEQYHQSELIALILQMAACYPQILGMLGVEGFQDEEEEDDLDDDELYDDDFEDEDEEFEDEEDEFEDEDEEGLAEGVDVEAIYEEADILLDEFQDYLKDRGIAREERVRYDETLQSFVDDYLAAYEVGKLSEMSLDEIDTYLRDYLLDRERITKRKLADTKQALGLFYTFLSECGHMPPEIANPIIQYCQS